MNNFLKIVIDKDRISVIENIQESYKSLLNDKNNILEGTAITAVSLNEKEIKVGVALVDFMENWEDIMSTDGSNKLNKSSILYYLRESTRLTTKEVRDSMKKYKKAYFVIKEKNIIWIMLLLGFCFFSCEVFPKIEKNQKNLFNTP